MAAGVVAIIPARYASTRLPGKPLADIHGRPMIQHVYERARAARSVSRVIVATDDIRIHEAVRAFGGVSLLTSAAHETGTDRLAEAARATDGEVFVNVQGDQPMLDPAAIEMALEPMLGDPGLELCTLSRPLTSADEMLSPNVVKVVSDARGDALYFSRGPIPFVRGADDAREGALQAMALGLARKHVGLYVYRRKALLRLAALPSCAVERAEGLEQLRALHAGMRMRVVAAESDDGVAVDTEEDLDRVRALMARTVTAERASAKEKS